jgi:hypothetical protein
MERMAVTGHHAGSNGSTNPATAGFFCARAGGIRRGSRGDFQEGRPGAAGEPSRGAGVGGRKSTPGNAPNLPDLPPGVPISPPTPLKSQPCAPQAAKNHTGDIGVNPAICFCVRDPAIAAMILFCPTSGRRPVSIAQDLAGS